LPIWIGWSHPYYQSCCLILQFVEEEKQKAAEELQEREHQTLQLQQENKRLSETTVILQTGLEVCTTKWQLVDTISS